MTISKNIGILYSGAKSWGGIETYLELLFTSADSSKVELTLLSLGKGPFTEKLQSNGHKVQVFSSARFNPFTPFNIAGFLKNNKFDLIVSQGTVANSYARLAALVSGVPSLVTVHSDPFYDYPNPAIRTIYAVLERLTRFPTVRYIAVSNYLKGKLVASGIYPARIDVIYNGVSSVVIPAHAGISPDPRDKQEDDMVVIGSIGRLHKVKNYTELIRACSQLQIKNYKLKIIGEGSERPSLEKLIYGLGLSDKIELVGNVDDISEQLRQIDIYIQPSLSEGFGLTVVEAMFAGKPVIVSPCGSLPEIVQDGKTGIILKGTGSTEIAEATADLVENKQKAAELAANGQKYAQENFGVDKFVRETEKAYLEAPK